MSGTDAEIMKDATRVQAGGPHLLNPNAGPIAPPPSPTAVEDEAPPLAESTRKKEPALSPPGEEQQEHRGAILRQQMLGRQLLFVYFLISLLVISNKMNKASVIVVTTVKDLALARVRRNENTEHFLYYSRNLNSLKQGGLEPIHYDESLRVSVPISSRSVFSQPCWSAVS